jgi:hypothetical protein
MERHSTLFHREVLGEHTSMHLRFFLLSRCKKLGKKVTLWSEANTIPMGCIPCVKKRETIMVFLASYLLNNSQSLKGALTVTKTKYLAPASSKRSSHSLALNLEPVKFVKKSS